MKLIILDRDGVINYDETGYVKSPDAWRPIPGSLEAIKLLTEQNYAIAIATNQAGIAKGLYTEADLHAVHEKMLAEILKAGGKIDFIAYCPHQESDQCNCRKPKIGMFQQITQHFKLNFNFLKNVIFVGDKQRDVEAGFNAGCRPVLVRTGYGEDTLKQCPEYRDRIAIYDNLLTVVQDIVNLKI